MFYMHWLLCKMNLPFHYYLVTVLVFHLYRFCAASRGGNSLRKSNIKTWRQQTIIGVRTFTPEVTFLSLLCSFQGKKKKSGQQQTRAGNGKDTFIRSSTDKKHSCDEITLTFTMRLEQLFYHPNKYSKPTIS